MLSGFPSLCFQWHLEHWKSPGWLLVDRLVAVMTALDDTGQMASFSRRKKKKKEPT